MSIYSKLFALFIVCPATIVMINQNLHPVRIGVIMLLILLSNVLGQYEGDARATKRGSAK